MPQAAIELNPEVSDFFRIIVKVGGVDLLGGGLNKDVWEVSAAPSGLSDGARAFYRNDHEDAFWMALDGRRGFANFADDFTRSGFVGRHHQQAHLTRLFTVASRADLILAQAGFQKFG